MPDIDAQDFRGRKTQVKKVQKRMLRNHQRRMMGDRASIIFSLPEEIGRFIVRDVDRLMSAIDPKRTLLTRPDTVPCPEPWGRQ
jgi:hypothetical protein